MKTKRAISLITALTLVFSLFISVGAYAEDGQTSSAEPISKEKLMLMIAAGEIPPMDYMPSEDNVKIKKAEAVKLAEAMLKSPAKFELVYTSLSQNWNSEGYIWNLEFRTKVTPGGNGSVGLDADTGEILHYNYWESTQPQQNYVVQMTREEARVLAEKFLAEKMKLDVSTLELQKEDLYAYQYRMGGTKEPVIYSFNYLKKINNIPFQNSNVGISIDGASGEIRGYNNSSLKFDPSVFPVVENIISPEQAIKKYRENTVFALQYVTVYSEKPYGIPEQKVMLAYTPVTYVNMVDAQTGEISDPGSNYLVDIDSVRKMYDDPQPMDPEGTITGRKIREAQANRIANGIKEKVEKLLGISFNTPQSADYPMPQYSVNPMNIWNYSWNVYSESGFGAYLSVSINGETGHISNIDISNWNRVSEYIPGDGPKEVTENVTWEQGKEKALDLIKSLIPKQYGFYADHSVTKPDYSTEAQKYNTSHYYSFYRVVDGVIFNGNNMSVSIDRETGRLSNFNFSWSDSEFPSADDVIGSEKALDIYIGGVEAKQVYFWNSTYDMVTQRPVYAETPKIVYMFRINGVPYSSNMIDAKTGKNLDWAGREVNLQSPTEDPELADHWAKRSMELLIAQGVLKNPNAEYDLAVTRAEAVKMAALSKGIWYYDQNAYENQSFPDVPENDEYFIYIESALRNNLITADGGKFNGSEVINKEEFAKLLVNLMGYSDIAKYNDIFKIGSEVNVSSDMIGYVAVCRALGVLPVEVGKTFDASSQLTYAEAVIALYKALSFIK